MYFANLLEVRKVSFATRLEELMKENKITQARLAEICNVTPLTVLGWLRKGKKLTKYKDDILKALSEFFDVDIAYLECTQLERKKHLSFEAIDGKRLSEDMKRLEDFESLFNRLGFSLIIATKEDHSNDCKIVETLDKGKIYKYSVPMFNEEDYSIIIRKDNTDASKNFTEAQFEELMQNLERYTSFILHDELELIPKGK